MAEASSEPSALSLLDAGPEDAGTTYSGPDGSIPRAACGKRPLADCPLQGWMKRTMSPAIMQLDFPALESGFLAASKLGPPGFPDWAPMALDGAAAAKAHDIDGVKSRCRSCHNAYQKRYRAEVRERRLP